MAYRGGYQRNIHLGDRALFLINGKKGVATISTGRISVCKLTFPANMLVGKPYGRHELAGKELVVLPANTRDLMENIRRGPQVILPKDAANIIFHANIRAGSIVLEAGSGSGSLTIALANAVSDNGKVFSVDISSYNTITIFRYPQRFYKIISCRSSTTYK